MLKLVPGDLWIKSLKVKRKVPNKAIFFDLDGTLWPDEGPGSIMNFEVKDFPNLNLIKSFSSEWLRVAFSNQTFFGYSKSTSIFCKIKYRLILKQLIQNDILDVIAICHHHPSSSMSYLRLNCNYRKPYNGMLLKAMRDFNLDSGKCVVIGDRITDIIAGNDSGIQRCFLISNHRSFEMNVSEYELKDAYVFKTGESLQSILLNLKVESGS